MTDSPTSGMVPLGKIDGFKVFLVPHFVGPDKNGDQGVCFLPPFWAVRTTNDKDKANMEFVHTFEENKGNNQIRVTLMKNLNQIGEKETLFRYVPKKAPEALEDLVEVPPPKTRRTGKHAA